MSRLRPVSQNPFLAMTKPTPAPIPDATVREATAAEIRAMEADLRAAAEKAARHAGRPSPAPHPQKEPAPVPTPAPQPAPATLPGDPMPGLALALKPHLEALGLAPASTPAEPLPPPQISITVADLPAVTVDNPHPALPLLLSIVANKVPLYMWSGAGTGKTRLARTIAQTLKVDFYSDSCSRGMGRAELLGYRDANGQKIETQLSKAFAKGGLYLLDEGDADALGPLATNRITANDHATFAGDYVDKHADFRFILAGNTPGTGQANGYRREPLDAAMLDRFFVIELPRSPLMEWRSAGLGGKPDEKEPTCNLAEGGAVTPEEWGQIVHAYRKAAKDLDIGTPLASSGRALFNGAVLARAGVGLRWLIHGLIRKGKPLDAWETWHGRAESSDYDATNRINDFYAKNI